MDQRTGSIIATIAAVVLCGLPGLTCLCLGALTTLAGLMPETAASTTTPQDFLRTGLIATCIGLVGLMIAVAVGIFALRRSRGPKVAFDPNEPIPPAI